MGNSRQQTGASSHSLPGHSYLVGILLSYSQSVIRKSGNRFYKATNAEGVCADTANADRVCAEITLKEGTQSVI